MTVINPTLILNETFTPPQDGKVYGIHSATQGFLQAFVRHGRPPVLRFRSESESEEAAITAAVKSIHPSLPLVKAQNGNDVGACAMFYNLPRSNQFWIRHYIGASSYSICGVNHSLTGNMAHVHLRDMFLAPSEAWDALICTSRASKAVIARCFEGWSDHLAARGGAVFGPPLRLPIIPLGVDTADLSIDAEARARGVALRRRLGIAPEALVVLFLGRLNFSSKAHPYPMFLALEQARAVLGIEIHLIQAGWYPSKPIEEATLQLAAAVAPSVGLHHVGAVTGSERLEVFAASDIFMSLSDNVQETFGLTLVEAMACGLPVVASDWDGYRDTVVHGRTGFLAATTMPAPGNGDDLGIAHGIGGRPYNRHLMDVAQATAIDFSQVRDAVVALGADPGLRARMGAEARARAVSLLDWSVVIAAYGDLWAELDACRQGTRPIHTQANPLHPDPFRLYEDFASVRLGDDVLVGLTPQWRLRLENGLTSPTLRAPSDMLFGEAMFQTMMRILQQTETLRLGSLLDQICGLKAAVGARQQGIRSIMWLMKIGALDRVAPRQDG